MKNVKKILIGLLVIALAVPMLVISTFAEDEGALDVGALVDLYQKETYYLDDFEASEDGAYASDAVVSNGATLNVVSDTVGKVLKAEGGSFSVNAAPVAEANGVTLNFAFKLTDGTVSVFVGGNGDNGAVSNLELFSFTADSTGAFITLHQPGIYDTPSSFVPSVSLPTDVWYTVEIVIHEYDSSYDIVLGTADATVYSAKLPIIIGDVRTLTLTAAADVAYYDGFAFYEGDTKLDFTNIDKRTCDVLDALIATYESTDSEPEEKQAAFAYIDLIINDNRYTAAGEFAATVNKAYDIVASYYADEFISTVYSYSERDRYDVRVKKVEDATAIFSRCLDVTGTTVDAELFARATALYEAAVNEVAIAKAESDAFIEKFAGIDVYNNDYPTMSALVDSVKFSKYDVTYAPIAEAYSNYLQLVANLEVLRIKVDGKYDADGNLIEDGYKQIIEALKDETKSFNERYELYVRAKSFYFVGAKYPGLDELIAYYESVEEYFASESSYCDEFIIYTNSAKNARSLTVRTSYLDMAQTYIDAHNSGVTLLELDYKNVKQCIDDCAAMRLQIVVDTENATLFITEVNKLRGVEDFYERKAIIAGATAVKPDIDIDGIAGYSAAYTEYETTRTTIVFTEGYAEQFMDIVSDIEDAVSVSERYELITRALEYVEGGVSTEVKGVGGAKAMLNTYVSDYNSEIEDRNAEYYAVVAKCADMTTLVAPGSNYGKLVAAIKKYFE